MLASEVRRLASGKDGVYHFDLSLIPSEFYEPLFRTLQAFVIRDVDSLGFSCDALALADRFSPDKPLPAEILASIAKQHSQFMNGIVAVLCYALPKSTRLIELVLSNLTFQADNFDFLITAISKSPSLRVVYFSRIEIRADSLRRLLAGLDPNQLHAVNMHECGIGSDSLPDIRAFIARRVSSGAGPGGIRRFNITGYPWSAEEDEQVARSLEEQLLLSPRRRLDKDVRKRLSGFQKRREIVELQMLEQQNAELKAEFSRLKQALHAIKVKEGVFVVGKQSAQFVEFFNGIEGQVRLFEAKPP
jgi:hypothetical protein